MKHLGHIPADQTLADRLASNDWPTSPRSVIPFPAVPSEKIFISPGFPSNISPNASTSRQATRDCRQLAQDTKPRLAIDEAQE